MASVVKQAAKRAKTSCATIMLSQKTEGKASRSTSGENADCTLCCVMDSTVLDERQFLYTYCGEWVRGLEQHTMFPTAHSDVLTRSRAGQEPQQHVQDVTRSL